jgi:hypothetical protein
LIFQPDIGHKIHGFIRCVDRRGIHERIPQGFRFVEFLLNDFSAGIFFAGETDFSAGVGVDFADSFLVACSYIEEILSQPVSPAATNKMKHAPNRPINILFTTMKTSP